MVQSRKRSTVRQALHSELLKVKGIKAVYYSPPADVKLQYPCIVYKQADTKTDKADNISYLKWFGYTISILSKNAEDDLQDSFEELFEHATHVSSYSVNNIQHHVYTIYQ